MVQQGIFRTLLQLHHPPTVCCDGLVPMAMLLTTMLRVQSLTVTLVDSQQIIQGIASLGDIFHSIRTMGLVIIVL